MLITAKRLAEREAALIEQATKTAQIEMFIATCHRLHGEWRWKGIDVDELVERLVNNAEEIVSHNTHHTRLAELSPWWTVRYHHGFGLIIEESFCGRTVPLAKLIEWHLKSAHATEHVDRIVANIHGLTYFVSDKQVLTVAGGAIRPGRLADPGNRYEIAGEMMKAFTGLEEIDWQRAFTSQVATMAAMRIDDTWHYNTSPLLEPVSV